MRELTGEGTRPMVQRLTRRRPVGAALATALLSSTRSAAAQQAPRFSYPVGLPGLPLGDGFIVRHGYATENTWYNPGWWHTAEDWYLNDGAETAGVGVYAAADGQVVFTGWEYPGRVVIVQHGEDLFSMYGHLETELAISPEEPVTRGQLLGTVLFRSDGLAPSHLHFEIRTFFMTPEVNGDAPRYGVACGFMCPPGPGYWPIDATEHPSALGWRNPTHVSGHRAWPDGVPQGAEVVVAQGSPASAVLWAESRFGRAAMPITAVPLAAGDRFPLLEVRVGDEAATGTSAEAYELWYRIELPDGTAGWVRAALPSTNDTGSDGRPSSVRFAFLPAVATPE